MQPTATIVEQGVAVPMGDGTALRADLWRPADGRPVPAILLRTPYGRRRHAFSAFLDPLQAGARGYAVVIQDVRGRGDSEGATTTATACSRSRRGAARGGTTRPPHTLPRIVGEHDLGWAGDGENARLPRTLLRFYDAVLDGREPRLPRATIYVLGARRWASLESWPPLGARVVSSALEREATLTYDPADPTPFRGGHGLLMEVPDHGFGPRDQRPLLARADVAALPLGDEAAGPLTLAGPVSARLRVPPTARARATGC